MLELKGKYCKDCKVYAETIEDEALTTIYSILEHPAFEGAKVRIMPDVHQGKGIVIGFSSPVDKYVNPNHVGVDIGCSMTTLILNGRLKEEDYPLFEKRVKDAIPTGFNVHKYTVANEREFVKFLNKKYRTARSNWPEMIPEIGTIDVKYIHALLKRVGQEPVLFWHSLGTLGGGNHFLEYGENALGVGHFTIHCGSRNFGVKVCNYWAKVSMNPKIKDEDIAEQIQRIKDTEPDKKKWHALITELRENVKKTCPTGYLSGDALRGYLSDMVIAQAYAEFNHSVIASRIATILQKFALKPVDSIYTTHNYINFNDHIIRKGAVASYEGERLIIPFNMRDGLAICMGKSNDDWNCTAPHGAGRIMSRSAAKKNVSLDEFKETMKNVYSTSVCAGTLDESPMVYKNAEEIVSLIQDTVDIVYFVIPKINIKATDGGE